MLLSHARPNMKLEPLAGSVTGVNHPGGGRLVPWHELGPLDRWQWTALARRPRGGVPFQQPDFVAAGTDIESVATPLLWLGTGAESVDLGGVFETVAPSPLHPYSLLRAWQTPYTFRDDLLLSGRPAAVALLEFQDAVRAGGWHAVEFPQLPLDSAAARALLAQAGESAPVSLGTPWSRPVLRRDRSGPAALRNAISPQRRKSLQRGWRWLERSGAVDIVVHRTRDAIERGAHALLRLEALGWKGAQGTALASRPDHRRFFLNLVQRLADRGGVAFVELRVADEPIAGLALLLHAAEGFAFKIGWDPRWERGCPGFQLMSQLVSLMPSEFPELECIDSCAAPDSFIGRVWPDRIQLAACIISLTRRAQLCAAVRHTLRSALTPG